MTNLSTAAQAVLGAYEDSSMSASLDGVDRGGLAAALRAAADQLTDATSGHTLYAIADELEENNG